MQLCRLQARLHCGTAKRWQSIRTFRTHRKWLHVDWTSLRLSHQCKLLKLHKIYNILKKLHSPSLRPLHNTNVITASNRTAVSQVGGCDGSNNYNTRAVTLNMALSKLGLLFKKISGWGIMFKVLIKQYNFQEKKNLYAVYGANLRKDMYNNISHLFVICMKSHHTPPRAKKLWALHAINGIQELNMGCTKMLMSEKQQTVHFTDKQHAISKHQRHIKLRVVQNIYALQYMYGFAKTHNYINAHCSDISTTMYHNEWLTWIMGLWRLVTAGQEMFLQNIFVTEQLTAHITALWTLPSMYTLMFL
jgi:hypothetical protein